MTTHKHTESGFTIAEVVVAVTLVLISVTLFMQASVFISSSLTRQARESQAVNIASTNLSKYTNRDTLPEDFDCSTHTSKSESYTALDSSSDNSEPKPDGNWGTFNQSVLLYSKQGCDGPITVESTVEHGHGDNIREISQVGYAS